MRRIRKCTSCGRYTLEEACRCGSRTEQPRPPKYSPEDRFARYRREVKEEARKQEGVL